MQLKKLNRRVMRQQAARAETAISAEVARIHTQISAREEINWGPLQIAIQEIELAGRPLARSEVAGPAVASLALRARDLGVPSPL